MSRNFLEIQISGYRIVIGDPHVYSFLSRSKVGKTHSKHHFAGEPQNNDMHSKPDFDGEPQKNDMLFTEAMARIRIGGEKMRLHHARVGAHKSWHWKGTPCCVRASL